MKITINLFYLVVAFYGTLPLNLIKFLKSVTRISTNQLIFIGMLIALISLLINILYIQSIGYNLEIDSGIFTHLSLSIAISKAKLLNWHSFKFPIKGVVFNDSVVKDSIKAFFKEYINDLTDEQHVICLFRVKFNDGIIATLGNLVKLTKFDQNYLFDHVKSALLLSDNNYDFDTITEIIISFGQRQGKIDKQSFVEQFKQSQNTINFQFYKKYKLPITMDPLKYGKIIDFNNDINTWYVQVTPTTIAKIKIDDGINHVVLIKNGTPILKFNDQIINNMLIRKIGSNTYHYNSNGELKLTKVLKPVRFIKKLKASRKLNNKFLTLDLETALINNKQVPYLCCIFDGKVTKPFYLSDYKSVGDMIQKAILSICRWKNNHHVVYVHNLANFDGIFLLKYIVNLKHCKVNLIRNNGKIISIDLKYKKPEWIGKDSIEISIRDSYQILPASLNKLAKYFQININKGIFPFKFIDKLMINAVTMKKALLYEGIIPTQNYFNDEVSKEEYNNYLNTIEKQSNNKWNLKSRAIEYCTNDCIVLFKVLVKFNKLYFDKFQININQAPTIASHAMRLFRTHFLKENDVSMIYGQDHKIIKLSYTGGATDMYIPTNDIRELIYCYDVNSLYPFVMANFPVPAGQMTYFKGDILKHETKPFGYFYCKVEAPDNLDHPILQLHTNINNKGMRTIAPTGKFEGMFFSEELYNAKKHGYKFDILFGYTFEKKYIFKEYVDTLYQLRLEYPKDHPMNYIAKLLLNSLYGRFGMRDTFDFIKILTKAEFNEAMRSSKYYLINDVIKLDNKYLIQYKNNITDYEIENSDKDYNVNIAVASAVTAYARIYMSHFKNNKFLKLFYTDTDSIYTNLNQYQMNELFPGIVNNKELGKLKLENICNKAIFLAPKSYCLLTQEDKLIYKIKGLIKNVPVTIKDFEQLLVKGSLIKKRQTKWYKSLTEGTIELLEQSYTLQQTDNKRKLIYNSNNKLINTKPYIYSHSIEKTLSYYINSIDRTGTFKNIINEIKNKYEI